MLKQKIEESFKKALKGEREIEVSALRMLKAAIFNKEKEKRYKLSKEKPDFFQEELEKESQLTDEEIIGVVSSEIKKRKEAILLFEKGKREDLAKKEKKEIEILKKYLPTQLSEEEIKKLAKEVIEELGATSLKDMGKVMGQLMPKIKGRVEGSLVSKIVKELLTSKKMNKKILTPQKAEQIQNEIYRKMSSKKKLEITSQLILLAKKLKESKEVSKIKSK